MEKRYQVFISSTFTDLRDERQSVLRAILELGHMPAGMELFPAADDSAWQLIKDVIDASDYYALIIGGRYGSLDETGIGFTEKEYDYALSTKKPVIPLLHENPKSLPRDKTEAKEEAWNKLNEFRSKIEKQHTCVYWKNAEDLKAKVIIGVTSSMKRHPAVGWVRANQPPSTETLNELLTLRKKITELEEKADSERTSPPQGIEIFQQGEDTFNMVCGFYARVKPKSGVYEDYPYTGYINPTWNEIFATVAPSMILETTDSELRQNFIAFFEGIARKTFKDDDEFKKVTLRGFTFKNEDLDTCIVQLRALGLIKESLRQRSVKNTETYWTLTPYGDYQMVQLRALKKKPSKTSTKKKKGND